MNDANWNTVLARRTPPTHCSKCGQATMWPEAELAQEAAEGLRAIPFKPGNHMQRAEAEGMALAFLFMLAGCAQGLCIFCQPSISDRVVATVEGGLH